MTARVGPPAEIKRADGPRRAIEIVALAGQLCATIGEVIIVTARATQKVPAPFQTNEKSADSLASGQFELLDDRLIKLQLPGQPVPAGRQIEPFGLDVLVGSQFGAPQAFVALFAEVGDSELHGPIQSQVGNPKCTAPWPTAIPVNYGIKIGPSKAARPARWPKQATRISNQASATSGIT